jgi:hypothetical protein
MPDTISTIIHISVQERWVGYLQASKISQISHFRRNAASQCVILKTPIRIIYDENVKISVYTYSNSTNGRGNTSKIKKNLQV